MESEFSSLEYLSISLIDGDRGKKYPKQEDFSTQGYCLFLSAKNVTKTGFEFGQKSFISKEKDEELRAGKLVKGDIVLTTRGTVGNVAFYDERVPFDNVRINSGMMILRADLDVWNRHFLYFVLTSHILKTQIESLISGSAVPQLPARDINKFLLPKIEKTKQNEIVKHLASLNSKIAINRQINQTLEQMAQALFKSWFVDFDPVIDNALDAGNPMPDALAERAARRQAARASDDFQPLPDDIRQLFPSEFEESELGWIPKGWESTKLNDLIDIKHGFAFKGEYFSDSETSDVLLTPGNVKIGGGFKPDKYKFYSGPIVNDYVFKVGDMFVNMTDLSKASDTLGYPAVVPDYKGLTFHHNQRLGKVIYSDHACSKKEFIYQILCSKSYRNEVLGSSTGTTVKHTSPKKILSHSLACSGLGQIEQIFDSKVSYLMKKLNENESNSRVLIKLRDTLLPKLISGELRLDSPEVEQAKGLVEAV